MTKTLITNFVILAILLSSCTNDDWKNIKNNATITSIENFVDSNPESKHILEAKLILDSLYKVDSIKGINACNKKTFSFKRYWVWK